MGESEATSAVSEFKVVNPATNQTEREFATATDAEVEQVLERSARAYQSWRTTAKDERAKVLLRVAGLYKERIDDLAALITREMGKPTREAKGEILLVVSIYRYYADQGPALLEDTPAQPAGRGGRRWSVRSRSARCSAGQTPGSWAQLALPVNLWACGPGSPRG